MQSSHLFIKGANIPQVKKSVLYQDELSILESQAEYFCDGGVDFYPPVLTNIVNAPIDEQHFAVEEFRGTNPSLLSKNNGVNSSLLSSKIQILNGTNTSDINLRSTADAVVTPNDKNTLQTMDNMHYPSVQTDQYGNQ